MTNYTVRFVVKPWHTGPFVEYAETVTATSPDEAVAMVQRKGHDYHEAEVSDEHGNQLAVYGADLWRDEWSD